MQSDQSRCTRWLCVHRPKESVTKDSIVNSVLVLQQFKTVSRVKKIKNLTIKAQISFPSLSPAEFTRGLNVRESVWLPAQTVRGMGFYWIVWERVWEQLTELESCHLISVSTKQDWKQTINVRNFPSAIIRVMLLTYLPTPSPRLRDGNKK